MTAKKTSTTYSAQHTELTQPVKEFKSKLIERIQLGNELFERKITTREELINLEEDFDLWNDYNLEYLKQSFNHASNEYRKNYDNAGPSILDAFKVSAKQKNELEELKERIRFKVKSLDQLHIKADLLKTANSLQMPTSSVKMATNTSQVFIVHGHDEEAKSKTARFVEKLGLEAIILHEQASSSKTIIEKIEEYSNVGFGIILYTPCDIGAKKKQEPDLKSRARQNVVFEHGFLIGKIGRGNVCAIVKGEIETPNDISGVVYVPMDDSNSWQYAVAKEMKKSGYEIDLNRI